MKRYRAYFFDLDGTLYRGAEAVPHAVEVLSILRHEGVAIRFLTNNSGATPEGVAAKLEAMGMEAHPEEVLTSGMAAASYAKSAGLRRIFAIGEPGLVLLLRSEGLEVVNADGAGIVLPDDTKGADAVVAGICRSFTYKLLNAALQQLLAGATFIATNPDPTYPIEGGALEPGAGSIVAAVRTCSGREPYIAGKPSPDMVRLAIESCRVEAAEALVVGDRADTDLAAGEAAGCPSVLVLTGVTVEAPEGQKTIADLRELLR